jgi:uncharacterized protein
MEKRIRALAEALAPRVPRELLLEGGSARYRDLDRRMERLYSNFDSAHGVQHYRDVTRNALDLVAENPGLGLDRDVAYVAAAYHDSGLADGRDGHHEASVSRLMADAAWLRRNVGLTDEDIETIADAIPQHSGHSGEPFTTPYAELLYYADKIKRDRSEHFKRGIKYYLDNNPERDPGEAFELFFDYTYPRDYTDRRVGRFFRSPAYDRQRAEKKRIYADKALARSIWDGELAEVVDEVGLRETPYFIDSDVRVPDEKYTKDQQGRPTGELKVELATEVPEGDKRMWHYVSPQAAEDMARGLEGRDTVPEELSTFRYESPDQIEDMGLAHSAEVGGRKFYSGWGAGQPVKFSDTRRFSQLPDGTRLYSAGPDAGKHPAEYWSHVSGTPGQGNPAYVSDRSKPAVRLVGPDPSRADAGLTVEPTMYDTIFGPEGSLARGGTIFVRGGRRYTRKKRKK